VGDESTADWYNERYFQGAKATSNYENYVESSRGPSIMLADTLHQFFRPWSALDVGCAVGHSVKRLRELDIEAYGVDISEWAVQTADVPYIRRDDFSLRQLPRMFDLVYSYDVVEHVLPARLPFALQVLWAATKKDLLVVPATYYNGETSDPAEPTHLTFESLSWWRDLITETTGATFNKEASERFAATKHSQVFGYSHRILFFSRFRDADRVAWDG